MYLSRFVTILPGGGRGFYTIGVLEAGWTEEELNAQNRRKSDRDALATNKELLSIWREIERHDQAWPFREPVDLTEVTDYLKVVAHPMGEYIFCVCVCVLCREHMFCVCVFFVVVLTRKLISDPAVWWR